MKQTKTAILTPCRAQGSVQIPPSKSIGHRALICAALCDEGQISHLYDLPVCEDVDATIDCLRALGVSITETVRDGRRAVCVVGTAGRFSDAGAALPCRESGSTLRFMIPLCLLSDSARTLTGSERLLSRPLDDYAVLLAERSATIEDGKLYLGQGNRLSGQTFSLSGKSSSQFITGLLMILPLLEGNSVIALSAPPESRSYIDMTLAVQARYGVCVQWRDDTHLFVAGGQHYTACDLTVDGDASGAAFFHALAALSDGEITVECAASPDIPQGDAVCPLLLARLTAARADDDLPVLSLANCPDLGPVLFASAAAARGAIFTQTDRLRLKESDRIAAMAEELIKFGARVYVSDGTYYGAPDERPSGLTLLSVQSQAMENVPNGWVAVLPPQVGSLHSPTVPLHGHNDHRIVMSLAVLAATLADNAPVTICDAQAVGKSFPDFFDRLRMLGVPVELSE